MPLCQAVHGLFCSAEHPLARADQNAPAFTQQSREARVVARGYLRRSDLKLLDVDTPSSI